MYDEKGIQSMQELPKYVAYEVNLIPISKLVLRLRVTNPHGKSQGIHTLQIWTACKG